MPNTSGAVSDQSDQTPAPDGLLSPSALRSQESGAAADNPMNDATASLDAHVEPHGATRTKVRVGRDGTAQVGKKTLQFARSLAGALVTVEA